jgi:hypothetical protein
MHGDLLARGRHTSTTRPGGLWHAPDLGDEQILELQRTLSHRARSMTNRKAKRGTRAHSRFSLKLSRPASLMDSPKLSGRSHS